MQIDIPMDEQDPRTGSLGFMQELGSGKEGHLALLNKNFGIFRNWGGVFLSLNAEELNLFKVREPANRQ